MGLGFKENNERNNLYSEESENWNRSSKAMVWFVVGMISACCLILVIMWNIDEMKIKRDYNSIVIEYKEGAEFSGIDEEGNQVKVEYINNATRINIVFNDEEKIKNRAPNISEYYKHDAVAFKDKNDLIHVVPLIFTMVPLSNSDKIRVYYYGEDYASAKALTELRFWVLLYVVLVPLIPISIFSSYKSMHPKSKKRKKTKSKKMGVA